MSATTTSKGQTPVQQFRAALVERFGTLPKAAEHLGVNRNHLANLLAGSESPIGATGRWSKIVRDLTSRLKIDPRVLWPGAARSASRARSSARVRAKQIQVTAREREAQRILDQRIFREAASHCRGRDKVRAAVYSALAGDMRPSEVAETVLGYPREGKAGISGRVRVSQLKNEARTRLHDGTWPKDTINTYPEIQAARCASQAS